MADQQGQYPTLVDPQFADYAEQAYSALARSMHRAPPPPQPRPPQPDNSVLTDIGHGLARGVAVTLPELAGQALQAFGAEETGKGIVEAARARGEDELYRTTGLAGEVASMLPTALGIGATALPLSGAAAVAAPALVGGALFGGATYTGTKEKGGTEAQALATGAIQGIGQAVGGAVAGRILSGAATKLRGQALERGFEAFTNPSFWGTAGRSLIHAEAVQLPTQAAAMAGQAAVEQGLPDTPTPWEAAKASFAPTALLTAALHPFGFPSIMKTNARRALDSGLVRDPNAAAPDRIRAVGRIAKELRAVDEEGATAWQVEALRAVEGGGIPELRPGYTYDPAAAPAAEAPAAEAPSLPPTPMQQRVERATGVTGREPLYPGGPIQAELQWQKMLADREAAQQGTARETLTKQLIDNPPPGVLSFAAWTKAQQATKSGPFAKGGRVTQQGTKDAYLTYVNEQLRQNQDIARREEGVTPVEGQGELFGARGYDVTEHGPLEQIEGTLPPEQIDIRGVEEHAPPVVERVENIEVRAPEEIPTAEVTEQQHTQMTAAYEEALNRRRSEQASAAEKDQAKQQQLRILGIELPTAPRTKGVLSRLLDKSGDSLAAEVRKIWGEKNTGPANKIPRLVEDLDLFHVRLTGKTIAEFVAEQKAGKAKPEKVAAEKPQLSNAERQAEIKRLEDEERRILTSVDEYKGESKYIALRAIAAQLRDLRGERQVPPVTRTVPEDVAFMRQTMENLAERRERIRRGEPPDATKATAEEAARTEPEPTTREAGAEAAAAAEQAARAGRNAEPGKRVDETTETKVGGEDAAVTGKEPEGGVGERERTGVVGEGEGVNRQRQGEVPGARPEDGGGNRAVEGRQEQRDAETQKHDEAIAAAAAAEAQARAEFEEATPELQQARARLAAIETKVDVLRELRNQYRKIALVKTLTPEQSAARLKLQARIGELAAEMRQVVSSGELESLHNTIDAAADVATTMPEHAKLSEAVGRTERALQRGEKEQAADPAYYTFTRGLDERMGASEGSNLHRVFNWLEAHKYAGTLPQLVKLFSAERAPGFEKKKKSDLRLWQKSVQELIGELTSGEAGAGFAADAMLGQRYVKVRRAAKEALGGLNEAQQKQFITYATRIVEAIRTSARVNEPDRAGEADYAKAMRERLKNNAQFEFENDRVAEMLRTGAISSEEATDQFLKIYDKYEHALKADDTKERGLAGINNPKLGAQVAQTPHAMGALDYIGKNHRNPIIKAVAKLMAKARPTASIRVIEDPDFNGGRYVPATDTIEIGRGGMNYTTILHETTHALAHAGINRALANMGRPLGELPQQHQREVQSVKTIQEIMQRFRQIADEGNPEHALALKDEHEFLSEAMNNPDIQRLLGARGWWGRTLDAIRDLVPAWVGLGKRAKSDFEQLVEAAPVLFGNPNRDLTTIYRNPLNYAERGDAFTTGIKALRTLTGLDWLNRKVEKLGAVEFARREVIATASLNHQKYMLQHILDVAKRKYPAAAPVFDRLMKFHDQFRAHKADRDAVTQLGMVEGNDIAVRAFQLRDKNKAAFELTGETGTEAVRLRVNANAKTLAEAQARNPGLTLEQWNSPDAQRLRGNWRRMEEISERMRREAGGRDVVTPVSLYHEMTDYHDLMLTRKAGEDMANALRVYGAHLVPEIAPLMKQLDTRLQAGNGPGDVPIRTQQIALDRAMKETLAAVRAIHDQEVAAGPSARGALDAASMRETLDEMYAWHTKQREVPYMHIGRAGNLMVMFTVRGGEAEWNDVGRIVSGTREQGGLERGWGPVHEGHRRVYMKFDNASHYQEAVEKLKGHAALTEWADGAIDEKMRSQDAATPGFVRTLKDRINSNDAFDAETKREMVSQLYDTFLQQLPDNSPLKASATRDGLNGYSTDYIQSFRDRATMSAQSLGRLRSASRISTTMTELGSALKGLRETPGMAEVKVAVDRYVGDFRKRVDELNRPVNSPFVDRIRAFPALWQLAISPAYWATIGYTPWQITMPMLGAKYGFGNSLVTMGKNAALSAAILNKALSMGWLKSEGQDTFTRLASISSLKFEFSKMKKKDGVTPQFTPEQLDLLDHIQWSSVLNFGQTNEIARVNPNDRFAGSKVMSIGTIVPHYIEISNRLITGLSAHELYYERAKKQGLTGDALAKAHAEAKDYAVQMIRNSDGDHSQANIARNLGRQGVLGRYTPLAVGFQYYFINTFENVLRQLVKVKGGTTAEKKEAAQVLAGISGMTALMAGALGMPMMGLMTGLSNRIGSMFSDPNDDPPDTQLAVRKLINTMVGGNAKAEEVIARGLPRLADIDLSSRLGLHDLAPFTAFLEDRRKLEDAIKDHAFNLMGPAIGSTAGIVTGTNAALQGDWPKFINRALPAGLRGFAKAYRQSQHGYETEGANNQIPIAAPTAWNLFAQSLGFTAGKRAEQSERSFAYKTNQQLLERRQAEIRNRIYKAVDAGDYDEYGRLMQEEIKFIMRHPQFHSNIGAGLKQRAQARAVGEMTGTGILAGKRAVYPIMQQFSYQ